jgi:hypothetical protein
MKFDIEDGFKDARPRRFIASGPLPFKVEYPYGLPGDSFRGLAKEYNATCVAYHKKVDPRSIALVSEPGNKLRYGPEDQRYQEIKASMIANGFMGGPGQRIILHVDHEKVWVAEGNHRMKIALEVGIPEVDIEIRYLKNADEVYHVIPFDHTSGLFKVIHE